jgi:hypothetical protein
MMKKIFGTLQIFPPRHYGTPRDRADLGRMRQPALLRTSRTKKWPGKIPAIGIFKPMDDGYAWLATALPSAACAAASRAIGTR